MKLLTTKKRIIATIAKNYQDPKEGFRRGLRFWQAGLKSIKRNYWKNGKFTATCKNMIDFCHATNWTDGVAR